MELLRHIIFAVCTTLLLVGVFILVVTIFCLLEAIASLNLYMTAICFVACVVIIALLSFIFDMIF